MKTSPVWIGAGWLATACAAFFIGRSGTSTDQSPSATTPSSSTPSATLTSRPDPPTTRQSSGLRSLPGYTSLPNGQPDYRQTMAALATINDPIERSRAFLELVEKLPAEDFQDVVTAFRDLGMTRDRMSEYAILLSAWARQDALAALDYATENTQTPFARRTILATWVTENTEGAIQWAKDNDNSRENRANTYMVGVIQGLAETDLARATQLIQEMPFSQGRGQALRSLMSALRSQGDEAAQDWITRLNDERLQAGAAANLSSRLAEDDPEAALAWAATLSESALERSAPGVIRSWLEEDKAGALSWLEQQDDSVRVASAGTLARRLEPQEAEQFLLTHEGDPQYDDAMRTFAWRMMDDQPQLGAEYIMRITNDRQRIRTFHRAIGGWLRRDRQGAIDYVENNDVPDSIRQRINQELQDS